jgi:hypothetical protein
MMATDKSGNNVKFGDYVAVRDVQLGASATLVTAIVRIVKLEESPKGVKAIGAYVDLVGNGRISKVPVDISAATLVMASDGTKVL